MKSLLIVLSLVYLYCNIKLTLARESTTESHERKSVFSVLFNNSMDFQRAFFKMIDVNLEVPAQFRRAGFRTMKAYTVVEPTPRETRIADKAMSQSFGLSSGFLPDNDETMNSFCDEYERKQRQELVKVYVIRKYTENLICRLVFNLIDYRIQKQNDIYCKSEIEKKEFIKQANQIKSYETALVEIRSKFKERLISIQHTNLGISKSSQFCCSFWQFKRDTLDAIQNSETRLYFDNMFEKYFHLMTQYFCFYDTIIGCKFVKYPEPVDDQAAQNLSLAMNMIRATARITSVIL